MALDSCPRCGAPVARTWRTCPACGAELDAGKAVRENQERLEREKQKAAEERERREREQREKREAAEAAARAEAERIARMSPEERARIRAEEEARIRKAKNARLATILGIIAACLVIAGGIVAFRMLNRPAGERLERAASFISQQDYPTALAEAEKVYKDMQKLNGDQVCQLSVIYNKLASISDKAVNETARNHYWPILRSMLASEDIWVQNYCKEHYPDDVVSIRLASAKSLFDNGKLGDAKALCEEINQNRTSLKFEDKCALASLYAAIGKVEDDPVSKGKCAWLYNQAISFNEEKAKALFAKNDATYGINIEEIVNSVRKAAASVPGVSSPQFAKSVVVTGTNVRLRRGPSLQAEILTDFYGKNIHPNKGEYLEYIGEADSFYKVRYHGEEVWISKDFTSLVQ